jgi:hypothetical protein
VRSIFIGPGKPRPSGCRVYRDYQDGIKALDSGGPWDLLVLDLDDPPPEKTNGLFYASSGVGSYHFAEWLERNPSSRPAAVQLTNSASPKHRDAAEILKKFYHWSPKAGRWER